MADNLEKKGKQDRTRISLSEPWEITYWTEELHCNEAELRAAVEVVGSSVEEVRMFLHG